MIGVGEPVEHVLDPIGEQEDRRQQPPGVLAERLHQEPFVRLPGKPGILKQGVEIHRLVAQRVRDDLPADGLVGTGAPGKISGEIPGEGEVDDRRQALRVEVDRLHVHRDIRLERQHPKTHQPRQPDQRIQGKAHGNEIGPLSGSQAEGRTGRLDLEPVSASAERDGNLDLGLIHLSGRRREITRPPDHAPRYSGIETERETGAPGFGGFLLEEVGRVHRPEAERLSNVRDAEAGKDAGAG